jgi:hypothetical protein
MRPTHDAGLSLEPWYQRFSAGMWTRFNDHERRKILGFLQYLRVAPYSKRTLAAIRRGLSTDWTSLYFDIGASTALGWIEREKLGHYVIVTLTEHGLMAVASALQREGREVPNQASS